MFSMVSLLKNQGRNGDIPSNQSALCVYKLEDIEERFIDGIFGCLDVGGDYTLTYAANTVCPDLDVSIYQRPAQKKKKQNNKKTNKQTDKSLYTCKLYIH